MTGWRAGKHTSRKRGRHRQPCRRQHNTAAEATSTQTDASPVGRRRTPPPPTRLTDGGRVFGAGSRALLLVKMVEQVPSCKESRADKLMDNHSRDGRRVSAFVSERDRKRETGQEKTVPAGVGFLDSHFHGCKL